MKRRIYLDYSASTPLRKEVLDAMLPYYFEEFGNPSSTHALGRKSKSALSKARQTIASTLGVNDSEIVFTSGGTEGNSLAILGIARKYKQLGKHIITTSIEHYSVLKTCQALTNDGYEVTVLSVDDKGRVSVDEVRGSIRPDTILVSVMYGNNETGVIQPIKEIGELLSNHQAIFHTDAVQAYGIEEIDVEACRIDLLTASSHKINGPKGVGFLYIRDGVKLEPLQYGGSQEKLRRAGTENVPGVVGLSVASKFAKQNQKENRIKYNTLTEQMFRTFREENVEFKQNGCEKSKLPHIHHLMFPGVKVDVLLANLDLEGVYVSGGSACTAGTYEPSHVLKSMYGEGDDRLMASIRISFGSDTTSEEVIEAARVISKVIRRLKK